METAQALQALGACIYMLTIAIVGFKLLWLWKRTRELPELFLAGSLILGGVFGAVLEGGGLSMREVADATIVGPLLLSGKLFGILGILFQGLFIRMVFRPNAAWATGLVAGAMSLAFASILGFHASGTFATGNLPAIWVIVEFGARVSCPIWLVIEGSRYHSAMRKRVALGLADPVVANRFLLWAAAGVFAIVILSTSLPPIFLHPNEWQTLLNIDLMLFSVGGIGCATFYWLTFFPPQAYRRWISARASSAS